MKRAFLFVFLFVVLPRVTEAGVALVQHVSKDAGTTTSSSLSFVSNNTQGNWLAVCIRAGQSGEAFSVSDSLGNVYRRAAQLDVTVDTPNGDTLAVFYAENVKGGPNTITVSESILATLRFAILEYSGVATANSSDVSASAQGTSATPNSGNATTTSNGDLLLGVIATANPATFTNGASFIAEERVPAEPSSKLFVEDRVQTSTGTISASASLGSSDQWGALLASFKAGAGAAPPSITSLSPTSGMAGTPVTISGANFGTTQGTSTVKFNGTAGTPTSWSATSIAVPVPSGATTGSVVVTVGGTASNSVSFTVTTDTTPPVVTITAPSNNATVSGTITLAATATDSDSAVSFVQFQVDGANVGAKLTSTPYSILLDTTALSNGSHTLTAVAQDPSANKGMSSPVPITVSNTTTSASTITLVQQAELYVTSGSSSVSQSFPQVSTAGNLIVTTVKWGGQNLSVVSVTDDKGDVYQSAAGPTNWSGTAKCAQTFFATNIAGGGVPITIAVKLDGASTGNLHLYQFEYSGVDVASPLDTVGAATGTGTNISAGPLTTRYVNDLIHAVTFIDTGTTMPGAGFQALTTYSGNLVENETAGAAGTHGVTATNSGGANWFMHAIAFKAASTGGTPTDNTPPVVTVTAPANGATVSGTITLTATATDPDSAVSFVQFQVDGANVGAQLTTAPYSLSLNTTTLSNATHSLTAVAQDPSGNVGTSGAVTITVSNATAGLPTLIYSTAVPLAIPSGSSFNGPGSCTTSQNCYRVPLPELTIAGATLTMAFVYNSAGANQVFSVTDDKSNTWTLDTTSSASNSKTVKMYHASNVSAGTSYVNIQITGGTNNDYWQALVAEFFNVGSLDGSSCSAGSSTTISAGSITPTQSGDLIFQAKYSVNTLSSSSPYGLPLQTSSFTPGLQPNITWSLASQLLGDGAADQYGVYNSTVPLNPTFTQAASDSYISCAVALKAASTGAAPTTIPRVVHQEHDAMPHNAPNPWIVGLVVDVPNSAVYVSRVGNDSVTSISSSPAPDIGWTASGADFNGLNGHNHVNFYCAKWNTPPGAVNLSINRSGTSNDDIKMIYVVQNGTCNLDVDSGGQAANQGSPVTVLTTCSGCITPTKTNDFIMANGGQGYCTATSLSAPSGPSGVFDSAWYTGNTIDGPTQTDENNFWMHFYNGSSLSPITVAFGESCNNPQGDWAGRVAAYQSN